MAERTVLQTMSGATIGISATLPATYDAAGYGATAMVYSTIGQIEDHGSHGVKSNIVTFAAVADAVLQKYKGVKDYGTQTLMVGCLPSDAGQDIAEAAAESQNRYSVKITYPVGTGESTPEIHYLNVLVGSFEWQDGSVDNILKVSMDFAICRKPVVVPAT